MIRRRNYIVRGYLAASLLLLCYHIFCATVFSQTFNFEEEWRWAHFTTESGLPSNRVNQILEGADGTIWAVTAKGIVWFNGYTWKKIEDNNGQFNFDNASMTTGIHDSMLIIIDGNIFRATRNNVRQIDFHYQILYLAIFQNQIYFSDNNLSLYRYDKNKAQRIMDLARYWWTTRANNLWYVADSGLCLYNPENSSLKLRGEQHYVVISSLAENTNGEGILFVVQPAEQKGIWEWDSSKILIPNKTERGNTVVTLDINSEGDALCVYQSGEVRAREASSWKTPSFIPEQVRLSKKILFSKSGDLWTATEKGVYLFRAANTVWKYISQGTPDLRNNINEILLANNGDIWLATGDGVVIRKPDGTSEWISKINGKRLFAVTALEQDYIGDIWIGSGSTFNGAYRWDGYSWKHFNLGENPATTMIHKIKKDGNGNLWFLTLSKFGAFVKEQPGIFLYNYQTLSHWSKEHNFNNHRVYCFSDNPDGTLWFGTRDGIFRYTYLNKDGDSIKEYWTQWRSPALKHTRTFTLAHDKYGNTWFGHFEDGFGLGKIDNNGNVKYYTTEDGLVDNRVNNILIDSVGALWISTYGGLSKFQNGIWTTYNEKTGLTCTTIWPLKIYSNRVFVGTAGQGLAFLSRDPTLPLPPLIEISRPVVEGSSVLLRWQSYAFKGELPIENIESRYRLNSGPWSPWTTSRSLTFPDLDPDSYKFQVQARGAYGQYLESGSRISFVILPPLWARPVFFFPVGITAIAFITLIVSYINKKIASDAAIRKSEEKFRAVAETSPSALFIYNDQSILYANPAAVHLTGFSTTQLLTMKFHDILHPQFHRAKTEGTSFSLHKNEVKLLRSDKTERWIELTTKEISFEGQPATLVAVFDVTDRKLSEMQLRSLTFELSRTEERERRRLATYLHDTIGQNLAFLKLKLHGFTKKIPREEDTKPIAEIRDIIETLIQDSQTLTFELSPPILSELGLEAALEWFAEKLHERHEIRCCVQFDKQAKVLSYDVQRMLFNAIRELAANIIKHAGATEIMISTQRVNDTIVVYVDDNGKGLDHVQNIPSSNKQGGFGLVNIRQWITTLGGSLSLINRENGGTRATIVLPINSPEVPYEQFR